MSEAPKEIFVVVADTSKSDNDPIDWCPPQHTAERAEYMAEDCPEPHRVMRYVQGDEVDRLREANALLLSSNDVALQTIKTIADDPTSYVDHHGRIWLSAKAIVDHADRLQAEKTRLGTLVAKLARLLEVRQWDRDQECDVDCLSCGAHVRFESKGPRKHKGDCELAAVLREAGVDVQVEG